MVDYLDDLLREHMRTGSQIIILCDFNCDVLKESLPQSNMFLEFIAANQLSQLITDPTRSTDTSSTVLDILITSNPNLFLYTGIIHSSVSDHFPIYGVLSTNKIEKKSVHHIITTRRTDMDISHDNFIKEIDRIPSSVIEIFDDPNDQLFVWQKLFTSILDEYYPVRRKRIRKKSHPCLLHEKSPLKQNWKPMYNCINDFGMKLQSICVKLEKRILNINLIKLKAIPKYFKNNEKSFTIQIFK